MCVCTHKCACVLGEWGGEERNFRYSFVKHVHIHTALPKYVKSLRNAFHLLQDLIFNYYDI